MYCRPSRTVIVRKTGQTVDSPFSPGPSLSPSAVSTAASVAKMSTVLVPEKRKCNRSGSVNYAKSCFQLSVEMPPR